ncbi:alpha/beta fold hydrolase [Chryseobacterium populi]|uniref:Alpha/beta hydrolase n=1 Tax=Chryseobacterium populi TaxID=1144316 RepID=J2K0J5_9FLAO|nr:hypothetical protein [Chryseobacterium populi]EJL73660.1 hypothetical protein PMI13_01422 [Chryseobacterium populi]
MKKKLTQSLFKHLLFVAFSCIIFLTSCSKDDDYIETSLESPIIQNNPQGGYPLIIKQVPYIKMNMPEEPQKLIYDENKNDVTLSAIKDTIVVIIEGGPTHTLGEDLGQIKGAINSDGLPNHTVVGMRQAHNINPTVFGSGTSFTNANAQEVNIQTIGIVEKVITWLKSNNKVVYLFGHSNGSLIVQNYMSSGKISPNGYVITGTRLKPVQAFIDNYPNNIDVSFTNGITVVTTNVPSDQIPYFNVVSKLQLNHNKNYITLLAGNPMLSNTVYSLSGKDEAIGRIELDEKSFLENNQISTIFEADGDHSDASAGIIPALKFLRL